MDHFPKILIITGAILIIVGLLWMVGSKFNLGRLPGDIIIDKGNVKFYFPIVTCIVLSGILSLIVYIIRMFFK